jgi:threonyl-tRNA synthetase
MPNEDQLNKIRHSAAHVLATAVQELFPTAKLGIGPVIENGFYYDFDLPRPLTETDFKLLTEKMEKFVAQKVAFAKMTFPIPEAKKIFADQPYKLELIEDFEKAGEKEVSVYKSGDFVDLCIGPHVKNTGEIGAFKLTHQAGAYWRGSEKNKMLTRIYGTAFATPKELDQHLQMLEEAKKRDHRVLGKELDLFVFSELVGKGLPLFTPKGAIIRRELERFVVDEEIKRGYLHVVTPHLAKVDLYRTSGHYPYYKETMYPPMLIDEEELILRPMTCPHHFMLYKSQIRSYKELPLRYAELASQFRYEKSGELTGLMRVRLFCLADAHIFLAEEQAPSAIGEVLDLINYLNGVLGIEKGHDYRYRLSLGDRHDEKKYYKDDAAWDEAEATLRNVLTTRKEPYYEAPGEAAFYGPKIDVQIKNVYGREETAFTVQYDFVMPKRFNLKYTANNGTEKQPIVIHRSSIGAIERTFAYLIEKYGGAFPVWLAPVQAVVIPISDKYLEYGNRVVEALKRPGLGQGQALELRVELDDRNETLPARIRDAERQKIPYMLVVGEKEAESSSVSVRRRGGQEAVRMTTAAFRQLLLDKVQKRALDL